MWKDHGSKKSLLLLVWDEDHNPVRWCQCTKDCPIILQMSQSHPPLSCQDKYQLFSSPLPPLQVYNNLHLYSVKGINTLQSDIIVKALEHLNSVLSILSDDTITSMPAIKLQKQGYSRTFLLCGRIITASQCNICRSEHSKSQDNKALRTITLL